MLVIIVVNYYYKYIDPATLTNTFSTTATGPLWPVVPTGANSNDSPH